MFALINNSVNQIPVWKDTLGLGYVDYANIVVSINNKIVTPSVISDYVGWVLFLIEFTDIEDNEDLNNGIIYLQDNEYRGSFMVGVDILFEEIFKVGDSIQETITTGGVY